MPASSPGLVVGFGDLVSVSFSPHEVHTHEHLCPVVALRAACAGVDLQDGSQLVLLTPEHITKLKFLNLGQSLIILDGYLLLGDLALLKEIDQYQQVLDRYIYLIKSVCPALHGGDLFQQSLCFFRIVPEAWVFGDFLFLLYLQNFAVDVKDTSSTHRGVL